VKLDPFPESHFQTRSPLSGESAEIAQVSYLREVRVHDNFGPFVVCREIFGFIPKLARAQTLLPRLAEAQVALESGVLARKGALSRVHKELILLTVSAAHGNAYCVTRH
jgi:alkylhydroperoxidase/carboxymuconolactone decarboxylase family protein YurZ